MYPTVRPPSTRKPPGLDIGVGLKVLAVDFNPKSISLSLSHLARELCLPHSGHLIAVCRTHTYTYILSTYIHTVQKTLNLAKSVVQFISTLKTICGTSLSGKVVGQRVGRDSRV